MTTSITAEYDALTSGFAIKTQQFGVLENIEQHLERVGVVRRSSEFSDHFTEESGTNDCWQILISRTVIRISVVR